jgi:hypothetical protein
VCKTNRSCVCLRKDIASGASYKRYDSLQLLRFPIPLVMCAHTATRIYDTCKIVLLYLSQLWSSHTVSSIASIYYKLVVSLNYSVTIYEIKVDDFEVVVQWGCAAAMTMHVPDLLLNALHLFAVCLCVVQAFRGPKLCRIVRLSSAWQRENGSLSSSDQLDSFSTAKMLR